MSQVNFDDLPIEEKIKVINETAAQLAEAMRPVIANIAKAFREFAKSIALVVESTDFPDEFKRKILREAKKERSRKRYERMMKRRK